MTETRRRSDFPEGGATMQIDALADELEEVGPPSDLNASMPPPLPPKKASPKSWVVGVLVVMLAVGLGIGAGTFFLGKTEHAPPPIAAPAPPEPAAPAPVEEPTRNVVQLEDVVLEAPPVERADEEPTTTVIAP